MSEASQPPEEAAPHSGSGLVAGSGSVGQARTEIARFAATQAAAGHAGAAFARWWESIAGSAESAVTDQSLDELFRRGLSTLAELLGVDTVSVLLANAAGDELIARASHGLDEEVTLGMRIRLGEGVSGRVLSTRTPLIVDDLRQVAVALPTLPRSGIQSMVAVPMLVDDRVLGVMHAGSREIQRFTQADADLLEVVAARLSSAVERVRLFESEHAARQEAERNADRLARLQRVTSALLAASNEEDIASALTGSIGGSDDPDIFWCGVWLEHDRAIELINVAVPDSIPDALRHVPLEAPHPLADVARERVPVFATDALAALSRYRITSLPAPITSFAALPIVSRGHCVGVFLVAYSRRNDFGPIEREFLSAAVDQVALALESVGLVTQQRQLADMSAFLAQAAKVTAEAMDLPDTLERLAALAVGILGDICLIDVLSEDGALVRMVARHRDPQRQALTDRLRFEFPPDPEGSHPVLDVIRTGETRWSAQMTHTFLTATTRNAEHLDVVTALGFRSYATVPLIADGEILGSITLVSTNRTYAPDDAAFAETLAHQVAAVVDNARRYDTSVRTSHALQQSLLPQAMPEVPGLQIATRYLAAGPGLEVGGDFYDLVALPNSHVLFLIGDVEGHDRNAAALMGHLRSAVRALASLAETPAGLLALVRGSWGLLGFDRMATVLLGDLDPGTGDLLLASAGHYPPLLVGDGGASYLDVKPDAPLGMDSDGLPDWRGTCFPGAVLLLYTDGVIDERGAGIEHSMDEMATAITGLRDPGRICDLVIDALPAERDDDVALLALRRDPNPG